MRDGAMGGPNIDATADIFSLAPTVKTTVLMTASTRVVPIDVFIDLAPLVSLIFFVCSIDPFDPMVRKTGTKTRRTKYKRFFHQRPARQGSMLCSIARRRNSQCAMQDNRVPASQSKPGFFQRSLCQLGIKKGQAEFNQPGQIDVYYRLLLLVLLGFFLRFPITLQVETKNVRR